jgi:hypothetical protein
MSHESDANSAGCVRGESVHQLERATHYGPIRADRGRRREELVLISGALTLPTNAVIAYNTWKLNDALEGRRGPAGSSSPGSSRARQRK